MTMMQSETQSDSELEVNLNGGRDHGAASHFKSCTLYLEVKLAEMLSASKHSLTDPTRPDANRFSVCWQVPSFLSQKIGYDVHHSFRFLLTETMFSRIPTVSLSSYFYIAFLGFAVDSCLASCQG